MTRPSATWSRVCPALLSGLLLVIAAPVFAEDMEKGAAPRKLNAKELASLLDRLEKKLSKIRTMRADFIQEKHLSIFTDVVKAEGVLLFRKPDTVRFEMTKPFRSVLIAAGKSAAKYEFIDGRWKKLKPEASAARMVAEHISLWLEARFREKMDLYDISAVAADTTIITLTPKNKKFRQFITVIELTLHKSEEHFSAVTIREPGGDFTRMLFPDPKHDIDLPGKLFDTTGAAPAPLDSPAEKSRTDAE